MTNTSSTAGNEVVELYANTPDAPAALERPIKRLEGFQKVLLNAGETKTVSFDLKVPDLAFFDQAAGKWSVDNGRYGIQISTSSADADIQLQDFVNVSGTINPLPTVVTAKPTMDGDATRGISERVLFPEGSVIHPDLTVAMNDDTLYGFKETGSSTPFPSGMTFSYSSDHPEVASVDGDGTIHAVGNGAATITATAGYGTGSATGQFVVRVVSDATSLSVNARPLDNFQPDVFSYDVVVPDAVSAAPPVAATAPLDSTVTVTQASTLPGVATVVVTGPDGLVSTYKVNFAHAPKSDDFSSTTLGPQWSWVRENPAKWSLTSNPGSMTITPEQGDLATATNTAKNLLLQPALGDFAIESKLTFSAKPSTATQQGGIIAYQDDNDFLKVDWERQTSNTQLRVVLEDALSGTPVNQILTQPVADSIVPASNAIWFRMIKAGSTYSIFYSVDGTSWTSLWTTGATFTNLKVGLFSYNGTATTSTLNVAFDYFNVVATSAPTTPPVTTATTSPAASNGWYAQEPTVTLIPTDNSGYGISTTQYSIDGGDPQVYFGPFAVTGDGTHTVDYYSTDVAGNVEDTQTLTLQVDTTAPTVQVAPDRAPDHDGWYNAPVVFTATGDDGAGSGIASLRLARDLQRARQRDACTPSR